MRNRSCWLSYLYVIVVAIVGASALRFFLSRRPNGLDLHFYDTYLALTPPLLFLILFFAILIISGGLFRLFGAPQCLCLYCTLDTGFRLCSLKKHHISIEKIDNLFIPIYLYESYRLASQLNSWRVFFYNHKFLKAISI